LFGWAKYSQRWGRSIRRFNAASIWVPKKQKKTPTLAGWGLYLTCGDGEAGAKTFGGAKDGNQAGIAMAHAIAMIEQSPELASECKINRNENSIEHMPTRSKYRPLSSANERSKNSKEGLNGNILIDETHVVDRDFINIISRAGISRSEPMHLEVSTAGNNPDGYGKERQDYARQVIDGAIENDQLFVAIYEAPQSLTDEELGKDPIKFGKLANPAWGHTAHEEEFLADYQQSRRTITGLAQFKMYRLNIWQTTANQWLRLDDWMRCGQSELSLDDMAGQPASLGLDLSKTRDMSALSVSIPHEDRTLLFVDLWMTEDYARENADKAAFLEWASTGSLHLIPGSVIQESFIRERFTELCELLSVQVLVKDKMFAADFTEWVEDKHGKVLQVDYPQYANAMEKPIDDFEADVIDQKIAHNNNPCLNWQAGHAAVHSNFRGFRIIQKPKPKDVRKVDGIVAGIMSHWGTKHLPKRKSVYKRRGVLTA
jgi:phage terminase large subunit-like protein